MHKVSRRRNSIHPLLLILSQVTRHIFARRSRRQRVRRALGPSRWRLTPLRGGFSSKGIDIPTRFGRRLITSGIATINGGSAAGMGDKSRGAIRWRAVPASVLTEAGSPSTSAFCRRILVARARRGRCTGSAARGGATSSTITEGWYHVASPPWCFGLGRRGLGRRRGRGSTSCRFGLPLRHPLPPTSWFGTQEGQAGSAYSRSFVRICPSVHAPVSAGSSCYASRFGFFFSPALRGSRFFGLPGRLFSGCQHQIDGAKRTFFPLPSSL
jgi:hypothetical protein